MIGLQNRVWPPGSSAADVVKDASLRPGLQPVRNPNIGNVGFSFGNPPMAPAINNGPMVKPQFGGVDIPGNPIGSTSAQAPTPEPMIAPTPYAKPMPEAGQFNGGKNPLPGGNQWDGMRQNMIRPTQAAPSPFTQPINQSPPPNGKNPSMGGQQFGNPWNGGR